jgi:hypothetical protein
MSFEVNQRRSNLIALSLLWRGFAMFAASCGSKGLQPLVVFAVSFFMGFNVERLSSVVKRKEIASGMMQRFAELIVGTLSTTPRNDEGRRWGEIVCFCLSILP